MRAGCRSPRATRLGSFEIVGPLGAGGMGEVYKARDTRLDRIVVIKVLPDSLAGDSQSRERFDREARAISSLNHPHICTLYDVGHQDGTSFIVMEHLEGETLSTRLDKGALTLDEALRFAIEMADALSTAHRAGIVHRDLKPGNVMLTKTGAKLLDFGLAKTGVASAVAGQTMLPTTPANITAQGTILGTFQYMSPEQLEGQDAGARSDIDEKPYSVAQGYVSPDGRFIAYNAVQAGQFEIYVQSFPQPGGGKWQASKGGGGHVRWPASGTELFYYSLDGRLMAVPVLSTQPFAIGSPIPLFSIRMLSGPTPVIGYRAQFDVAKDGRFLMNLPVGDAESPPISVVLNWAAGFKK